MKNFSNIIFLYVFGYYFVALISVVIGNNVITILFRAIFIVMVILSLNKYKIPKRFLFLILIISLYGLRLLFDLFVLEKESTYGNDKYLIDYFIWGIIPLIFFILNDSMFKGLSPNKNQVIFANLFYLITFLYAIYLPESTYSDRLSIGRRLNPISFAMYSSFVFYLNISTYHNIKNKIIVLLSIIPLIGLILTQSRGNYFAIILIGLTILLNNSKIDFKIKIISIIIFGSVIPIILFFINFDIFAMYQNVGSEKDLSALSRLDNYYYMFNEIKNNWISGYSILTTNNGYIHNVYLELIASIGMLGFIFLIYIAYIFLKVKSTNFYVLFSKHCLVVGLFSGIFASIFIPLLIIISACHHEKSLK